MRNFQIFVIRRAVTYNQTGPGKYQKNKLNLMQSEQEIALCD